MKTVIIDGITQRVFVLAENSNRMVYISTKTIHRVDYERLLEIESKFPGDMLKGMEKTALDNGRNALVQYDSIIQVAELTQTGAIRRIRKPHERVSSAVEYSSGSVASPTQSQHVNHVNQEQQVPVRKKPGPKPKPKHE